MVVRGPRFSLRYLTAADAPALFELGSDPDVTRFFSWGPYREEDEAHAFIESLDRQRETGERLERGDRAHVLRARTAAPRSGRRATRAA